MRWIGLGVLNDRCEIQGDRHIVFLGDIISYGCQQYEALMIALMLKATNPDRVHLNCGNHERDMHQATE